MLDEAQLRALMADLESFRVERLGFVNRFGRGVARAQDALARNGSDPARFEFGDTFFGVTIPARP